MMYKIFYKPRTAWISILKQVAKALIKNWIKDLRSKNRGRYRACVTNAAINFRSEIEMKLMGL